MLPNYYACSSCGERFHFNFREACYYLGSAPIGRQAADDDLLTVPIRPAWCKDCDSLCIVEDIAPLRVMEGAYGMARKGQPVRYPIDTEYIEAAQAEPTIGAYLRWRMERRHAARALCCGGSNYQFMDVERPLIKHAECDFGFINGMFHISSYCGSGPGVRSPANIRLYDTEGDLIGRLTWWKRDEGKWDIEPMSYPTPVIE